jgi:error-prone DNA polymerase
MIQAMEVTEDYSHVGLSLKRHPLSFLRDRLRARNIICAGDLLTMKTNYLVNVAGIVLVRQRPGTARGVVFMTIEDETGIANLIIWPNLFEKQRVEVLSTGMLVCHGVVQKEGRVIHVIAKRLTSLSQFLPSTYGAWDRPTNDHYIAEHFEGTSRDFR